MDKIEKKWTIEEGIEEADAREKGTANFTSSFDYPYKKVGDIRTCHTCKVPVDVVAHTLFELDTMSITFCNKHGKHVEDLDWGDKPCLDEKGRVLFDPVEYRKESKEIHETIHTIREAIEKIRPRDDTILEYDRVKSIVEHGCFSHKRPKSFEFWFFREFVNYLGLRGRLSAI